MESILTVDAGSQKSTGSVLLHDSNPRYAEIELNEQTAERVVSTPLEKTHVAVAKMPSMAQRIRQGRAHSLDTGLGIYCTAVTTSHGRPSLKRLTSGAPREIVQ
jgi:hypothetical protein